MKLLLSSSASSCSSSLSNASLSTSICRSKTASAGCLAGVFRKLLCSRNLPTYPSDHIPEESDTLNLIAEREMENKSAPGIVARLMGLNSLPEIDVDQAQLTPISTSLPRSMNSVDYSCVRPGSQRRQLPILLNSENEDYLVLSFENVEESKEFRRRRKRNSKSRERKTEKPPEKKKEENPIRTRSADYMIPCHGRSKLSENSSTVIRPEQISGDRKMRTKESKNHDGIKLEESINISEDSSPVSVLDRCQFLSDPELPTSDDSVSAGLNSRRKLSTELENYGNGGPRNDNNLVCEKDDEYISKAKEISYVGEHRRELQKQSQREMCEIIRRLTEAEMVGSRCNTEDFQSVGAEIQWEMLGELIDELVHQLSVTHQQIFQHSEK